jgi:hypothetical protein
MMMVTTKLSKSSIVEWYFHHLLNSYVIYIQLSDILWIKLVLKLVFENDSFNICRVFLLGVLPLDTYNVTMSTFYSVKFM